MFTPTEEIQVKKLLKLLSSNGQYPQPKQEVLFSELVKRDIRINKNVFSKSHIEVIEACSKHLLKYFGDIPISKLMTRQNILDYRTFYLKTLNNKTYFRTLQSLFQRAVELDIIEVNHFANIKLPKQQEKIPITISDEELEKILNFTATPYREIVIFLVNTGLRIGELVQLVWNDVSLSEGQIIVGKSFITKTKKIRVVPLNLNAKSILENLLQNKVVKIDQQKKFVFAKSNGYKYTTDRVSKVFKKACRLAEVNEEIHLHSLRATFCSNLLKSGCTLYKASLILGHSNIETTRKYYSNINIQTLKDAVNLLDGK